MPGAMRCSHWKSHVSQERRSGAEVAPTTGNREVHITRRRGHGQEQEDGQEGGQREGSGAEGPQRRQGRRAADGGRVRGGEAQITRADLRGGCKGAGPSGATQPPLLRPGARRSLRFLVASRTAANEYRYAQLL